jgi:hypothetical protein
MSNLDNTPNLEAITAYFEKHPEAADKLAQMGADATLAAETAAAAAVAAVAQL